MNFLKSILSDEQDPPEPNVSRDPDDVDDGWSFGGMIKTLAMQSETVIEIYRKDLEEFGSGLRKETELFRETASRAVKELPASLEAAQGVLKSTVSIISKESLGFSPDGEGTPGTNRSSSSGRYSRFQAQVSAIQNDLNTFCAEPEDGEDYGKWKLGFELENYSDEIERLIGGDGILEGVYKRVVPSVVDDETFWCRYFYRVEKLKKQESLRANLVRRAISVDDDELSSWDFDENVKEGEGDANSNSNANDGEKSSDDVSKEDEKVKTEDNNDGKVVVENDAKMVSSQETKVVDEEEELSWDEIEDTGAVDHQRKDDLRKRLNGGGEDDDEDLNWDIEDEDDEPEPVRD